ncbi:hypothetical protein [Rathayibacter sp. AY1F3]|uniref:hypothetical protein n=1 Tax=Rathayibacter sp. AY1F3 TaxID=2080558 RepID=UPI0011B060D1|nr:hypothetical protein [Rathayibacter sp. AY1F3]
MPVLSLKKELLLDIRVEDLEGHSLPLLTKDQSSFLSYSLILSTARHFGWDDRRTTPEFRRQLFNVVNGDSVESLLELLGGIDPRLVDGESGLTYVPLSENERSLWISFLNVRELNDLLFELSERYFLIVELVRLGGREVELIKVRWTESASLRPRRFWTLGRFGLGPLLLESEMIASFGDREHYRVEAPPGTTVRRYDAEEWDERQGQWIPAKLKTRGSLTKVSMYSRSPGLRKYRIRIGVEPTRSPFLVPATVGSTFLAFIVSFFFILEYNWGQFSGSGPSAVVWRWSDLLSTVSATDPPANLDGSVALLAIVPSLLVVYLVKAGEHELVTKLLSIPRLMLLCAALAALVATAILAAQLSRETIEAALLVAASLCALSALQLIFMLIRSSISHYRALHRMRHETFALVSDED